MNIFKTFLSNLRLLLFQEFREHKLAEIIFNEIIDILGLNFVENITILDFGSGKKPVIIEELSKFGSVNFLLSIDAIGRVVEISRWKSNWNLLEKNMEIGTIERRSKKYK